MAAETQAFQLNPPATKEVLKSLITALPQVFARRLHDIPRRNHRCQGVFNILRDWYNNQAGRNEPKAMDKFEHGHKVIEAVTVPRTQLFHHRQVDGR